LLQTRKRARDHALGSHNGNMQSGLLLPLFPLQVVLFPGAPLPLHIFEDRYKEMIGEAIKGHTEFGVLLATGQGLASIGCTATVERVLREYPDGRLDIMTRGRRRFELLLVNEERTFLRGSIEFVEDDTPQPALSPHALEDREKAIAGYNQCRKLASDAPLSPAEAENPALSFVLAEPLADLGLKQTILGGRSEAERLKQLADYFPKYLARELHVQKVKATAPQNGHGKMGPTIH
jgi:Lon protease-like protein